MGAVFSAFALGYAVAQIPSGWFADRVGPRVALAAVVSLWSLFTALTGAVANLSSLLLTRFLFGIAEAGAFPGSARAFYNWLPARERGLANGILFSGGLLGGAVAFPFFAWLLEFHGWRSAFYLLSVPGILWALCWLLWFQDYPRGLEAKGAVRLEPQLVSQMSFGQVFCSQQMALAMAQYFAGNFTFFICITWMHPYLKETYGLSPAEAAGYSMIPLLFGATANWVSGLVVDFLYRSNYHVWSRRLPAIIGFVLAAGGVFAVSVVDGPRYAVTAFAVAAFGVEMTISPSWAYCMDIGGRNSGAVSGSMNMVGNFGAFVSANAFPHLYRFTGEAATYFRVAAVLNTAAVVCWFFMSPKSRKDVVTPSQS